MRPFQFLPILAGCAAALSSAGWRSQSIYQIVTDRFANNAGTNTACNINNYCGGTWRGIINKLDYIQGMGFTAIWISPIVKNIASGTTKGDPYHGYWAQDIYSLNSAFGTAADLQALSTALHTRGMYLMVDVVTNHLAFNGPPNTTDFSTFGPPFNTQAAFHQTCPVDYSNSTSVQQCWAGDNVVTLPDLRNEDAAVKQAFSRWIGQLVQNYTIDGLRLDGVMAVNRDFFPDL
jgi:alpha-amylase